jgi:uncharacterized protein
MQMNGRRSLPATTQQAWQALNDPNVLQACIPGCDRFELVADDTYEVGMQLRIGPVSARFGGRVVLSEREPERSYRIAFEGQGGAAGFGKGTSSVHLVPMSDGCELHYDVNASVGGRLAQLGQRLIDAAARQVADDFFKRLEVQIRSTTQIGEVPSLSVEAPATPAVPPRWLWWAGSAGLALVLLWLLTRVG